MNERDINVKCPHCEAILTIDNIHWIEWGSRTFFPHYRNGEVELEEGDYESEGEGEWRCSQCGDSLGISYKDGEVLIRALAVGDFQKVREILK